MQHYNKFAKIPPVVYFIYDIYVSYYDQQEIYYFKGFIPHFPKTSLIFPKQKNPGSLTLILINQICLIRRN